MIDAAQAIKIAEGQLPSVVPAFAALHPFVEEVEQSSDGSSWVITFRAKNKDADDTDAYGSFLPFIAKMVRVTASSGDLPSVLNSSYR